MRLGLVDVHDRRAGLKEVAVLLPDSIKYGALLQ